MRVTRWGCAAHKTDNTMAAAVKALNSIYTSPQSSPDSAEPQTTVKFPSPANLPTVQERASGQPGSGGGLVAITRLLLMLDSIGSGATDQALRKKWEDYQIRKYGKIVHRFRHQGKARFMEYAENAATFIQAREDLIQWLEQLQADNGGTLRNDCRNVFTACKCPITLLHVHVISQWWRLYGWGGLAVKHVVSNVAEMEPRHKQVQQMTALHVKYMPSCYTY